MWHSDPEKELVMQRQFPPTLSNNNLPLVYQGKTRDTYGMKDKRFLLIVATDRLSTHNIVHKSLVPMKGEVLTAMTVYWMRDLLERHGIPHHLVASGREIYAYLPGMPSDYPDDLPFRAIIVRKYKIRPIEFVLRAYLCGSLYLKFYAKGRANPYGIKLPKGLQLMTRFREPIFTPTDKSETDDERRSKEVAERYTGALRLSTKVFNLVRMHLNQRGIELVDSKFEIGKGDKGNIVADEICTPDCSRFAELNDIKPGQEPTWLDKQIARDEAERIWNGGDKYPIEFSQELIDKLSNTYLEVFRRATDMPLAAYQHLRLR